MSKSRINSIDEYISVRIPRWYIIFNIVRLLDFVNVWCCKISENIKGKAVPLQAWTGPECSRNLRLPDFKTIDT